MKFRTSFQVPRSESKDHGDRRPSTAIHWKIPSLREKQSKPSGLNSTQTRDHELPKKDELSLASPSTGTQEQEDPLANAEAREPGTATGTEQASKSNEPGLKRSLTRKKAMQEWVQKTGAQLRTQSLSLRARGQKLSEGMRGNRKSRVVRVRKHYVVENVTEADCKAKPSSKRNSQRNSQVLNIRYTADDDVIEKILGSQPREKQASAAFLSKQRERVQARKPSSTVSPLSETQAERDRKPLTAEEIVSMFVGAPYFSVEGKKPQIIFKGGDAVEAARYSTDYGTLDVSSFGACTLGQHRTRQLEGKPAPCCHEIEAAKEESSLLEVPTMLAAGGREPGATGFEHYLQMPISDSLLTAEHLPNITKRKLLRTRPEELGLRKLDLDDIVKRLNELGDLYATEREEAEEAHYWNKDKVEELGEDLFGNVLDDEMGPADPDTGSISLRTQISALQQILDEPGLWHNFSIVEWRIRAGQLLWSESDERPSERSVLLLQITLAAELLVRVKAFEAVPAVVNSSEPLLSAKEAESLESDRSMKVKWDLLLAERFLDNLTITAKKPIETDTKKLNRSSLWSAITFLTARETADEESSTEPLLSPKDDLRQIDGLVNFAEALRWPHAKDIRQDLEAKLSAGETRPQMLGVRPVSTAGSVYATPLSSPMFPGTPGNRSSFFGFGEQKPRPGVARTNTAQSVRLLPSRNNTGLTGLETQEAFEVGGWLSRSWLSGLVLPGESASHFLISTLLENCPQAITALGAEANLYGGFVYEGRSYWSKACVVGRVLGAVSGSAECMGWISVPGAGAERMEDGWVNVNVKDAPGPPADTARIKDPSSVSLASDPLHGENLANIQAGDFTTPTDSDIIMSNEVKFSGMAFASETVAAKLSKDSSLPMGGIVDPEPSDAQLQFSATINGKPTKVSVPLKYDVHFVTSYPCHPPGPKPRRASTHLLKGQSTKLSFEQEREERGLPTDSTRPTKALSKRNLRSSHAEKELPPPPAHPLHIDYHVDIVPIATMLSAPADKRPRALLSPHERELAENRPLNDEDVVVLDCRGAEALELLGRAWCAKVGEHALIGKSARTCLACCVREARALAIAVVIRT